MLLLLTVMACHVATVDCVCHVGSAAAPFKDLVTVAHVSLTNHFIRQSRNGVVVDMHGTFVVFWFSSVYEWDLLYTSSV